MNIARYLSSAPGKLGSLRIYFTTLTAVVLLPALLFGGGTLALGRGGSNHPDGTAVSGAGLLRFPTAWLWTSRPVRYLLFGGALIIAAVAVATAVMVDNFRDRALADTERELKNTALILAGQIDRKFQAIELIEASISERVQSLQIMSSEQLERQMSGPDVHRTLSDKISGLPYIDAVSLINADGNLINFSRFWPITASNIADRDRFIALKSHPQLTSFIGEPVHSRTTGSWTVHLVRKLSAPDGEFLGLVQGAVLLTDFEELFGSVILGGGSSITLFRSDGVLLARHPRIEGAIGKTFTAGKEAIGTGNSGTRRFLGQIDGKDRLLAAHRIAHYPLHISVAMDTDAALAGWRKETRLLLGAGGFSTLAIAAMIILIVRQLSQREQLSRHRLVSEKQRLDTTINSMTQGLLLFDASARIAVCNRRYIEMYGLSPDVVKAGCHFRDLMRHRQETGTFRGDIDEYCASIIAGLTLGKVSEVIAEIADGRSIRILYSPVATGGWVATHEDITERQRLLRTQRDAEELLRRQKLQLDAALNNMKHGLCMFDATGRIVLFNRHYADIIGLPESDLIDVSLLDLWRRRKASGQFTRDPEKVFTTLLADMQASISKTKVISAGGRELRIVDQPMTNGGWVATIEDITEMRRAEDERNHNREFINQIIDNVPVAIIVKNASDRRVAYINQATEKLWGISRATAIGKTVAELFPAARADLINQTDDTILQSAAPLFVTEQQMLPSASDGQSLVSRKLVIRALDGAPKYLLSVIEDVTERKSIEAQLRQSQKMEAIGNLTGGVAHDFNNLLTVMIGNLDLLLEDNTDRPQMGKMLDTVLDAALRGAELTKQMLAFSRRQPLHPKCVELSGLIDKTVRLLSRTLSEGISVDVRTSPDVCPIMVDEAQLEAALINIAINARDAMSHGGILTIATDNVLLKDEDAAHRPGLAAGEHVLLTITDTGTGMSAEVINRIFEPFFTTKETGKGTGLGLSMVYGFVKQSGGYIGVTSTPGAGTKFELLFPTAASSADTGTTVTDGGKPRPTGEVVLAVDDQPQVRATAVAYLKSLGYQVIEADCANAALDTLAGGANIDLLFTDIVMPGGINGIELASLARAQRPGLKVLYTSGYPGAGIVDGAQVDIEGSLLIKPYRKLELAAAITKVLLAA